MSNTLIEQQVGKWIIPISKNLSEYADAVNFIRKNYNYNEHSLYRIAEYGEFYIVIRQLTKKDLNSLDFVKFIRSFNYKKLKNIRKIRKTRKK